MARRFARIVAALLVLSGVAAPAVAQPPDRAKAPEPGPPPALALPAVQKHALSSGLPVWIVEQHEVPVARVLLVSRAGTATDPSGKAGVASMTATMMLEGAGTRDALALADAIDHLGASIDVSAGLDSSIVSLGVPVARLDQALPLMADVVKRPTFPAEELERQRQQALTGLLQVRDNPAAVASRAFPLAVFGPNHRYGLVGASRATLTALTVDELKAAHGRLFHPAHSLLVVVGDVKAPGVLPLLERQFGAWRGAGGAAALPAVPAAPQVKAREIVLIDRPGAPQSHVRIGNVGVARDTPDYFPILVANTILGGAFTSRLNQNLRETHGYTYGASSRFEMRRAPGAFMAGAAVQADKTAEAIREFFNEFGGMLKPVPADELAKARNYLALGYPAEFETTGDIAGQLAELFIYGLPEDFPSTFVPRTLAVTADQVLAAARAHVTPDRVVVLVVGDRAKLEGPLKSLGLGRVRTMTLDEVMRETPAAAK